MECLNEEFCFVLKIDKFMKPWTKIRVPKYWVYQYIQCIRIIQGAGFNTHFFLGLFTPTPWGFMIQFDVRICFKWLGEKPPPSDLVGRLILEIAIPSRLMKPNQPDELLLMVFFKLPFPKTSGWILKMRISKIPNLLFKGSPFQGKYVSSGPSKIYF